MNSILLQLEDIAVSEGYDPGSPEFGLRMLELRVSKCVELQNVSSCSTCDANDHCELSKSYLRGLAENMQQRTKKKP